MSVICKVVLVQAYGREPVLLCAGATSRDSVEVYREGGDAVLNYPVQYVYEFDADLYEQLKTAFEQGQDERLVKLWKSAKRYVGGSRA